MKGREKEGEGTGWTGSPYANSWTRSCKSQNFFLPRPLPTGRGHLLCTLPRSAFGTSFLAPIRRSTSPMEPRPPRASSVFEPCRRPCLRYAHPRICVILAILFNVMIIHGVVPSMFGIGIVVPLIKGHNLDNSISENYRGTYEDSYFKNF